MRGWKLQGRALFCQSLLLCNFSIVPSVDHSFCVSNFIPSFSLLLLLPSPPPYLHLSTGATSSSALFRTATSTPERHTGGTGRSFHAGGRTGGRAKGTGAPAHRPAVSSGPGQGARPARAGQGGPVAHGDRHVSAWILAQVVDSNQLDSNLLPLDQWSFSLTPLPLVHSLQL